MMNKQNFSNAQAIAAALPLMGAHWHSVSVQNLLPAYTMHYIHTSYLGFLNGARAVFL